MTAPPPPRRRRLPPWGWSVVGLLVLAAGLAWVLLAAGLAWANEPYRRREILFEAPLRLEAGAFVTGRFTPDHAGPYAIQLRFRKAWSRPLSDPSPEGDAALDRLSEAIGGDWFRHPGPPGLTASYEVRDGEERVAGGVTGERFSGGFGPREVRLSIAWIADGRPRPHAFDVRIDRAVERLATWEARLVVAASGDYISYAWLEAELRLTLVAAAAALSALVAGVVATVRWDRDRRDDDATPDPTVDRTG